LIKRFAQGDDDCIATPTDFERLRDDFRSTAKNLAVNTSDSRVSFDEKNRPLLERPFAEPPSFSFSVSQNPFRIDYGWVVKLAAGCAYSEAKPGYILTSVDFDIVLNADNKIIDDRIHYP